MNKKRDRKSIWGAAWSEDFYGDTKETIGKSQGFNLILVKASLQCIVKV